jgi:hypothetical protein
LAAMWSVVAAIVLLLLLWRCLVVGTIVLRSLRLVVLVVSVGRRWRTTLLGRVAVAIILLGGVIVALVMLLRWTTVSAWITVRHIKSDEGTPKSWCGSGDDETRSAGDDDGDEGCGRGGINKNRRGGTLF